MSFTTAVTSYVCCSSPGASPPKRTSFPMGSSLLKYFRAVDSVITMVLAWNKAVSVFPLVIGKVNILKKLESAARILSSSNVIISSDGLAYETMKFPGVWMLVSSSTSGNSSFKAVATPGPVEANWLSLPSPQINVWLIRYIRSASLWKRS